MSERGQPERATTAFLQHQPNPRVAPLYVPLARLPFIIGRGPTANFVVHVRQVSKEHARIEKRRGRHVLTDLESRNGTYVNGRKLREPHVLTSGDVIHVASLEFIYGVGILDTESGGDSTIISSPEVDDPTFKSSRDLYRILAEGAVRPVFQPIVALGDERWIGFEALGRNALSGTNYSPIDLFRVAAQRGRADALSRLMRDKALEAARDLPRGAPDVRVFFNLHPAEMEADELGESLAQIPPSLAEGQRGVIEIHESAVTDPVAMRELSARLRDLGLGLAYDDFGAGQSRLMELAEVPPDVIKLDKSLVRDIDASDARQGLVAALVKVMLDLGVEVLAEGIESRGEAECCAALGCTLGQGYYYCRPGDVSSLRPTVPPE